MTSKNGRCGSAAWPGPHRPLSQPALRPHDLAGRQSRRLGPVIRGRATTAFTAPANRGEQHRMALLTVLKAPNGDESDRVDEGGLGPTVAVTTRADRRAQAPMCSLTLRPGEAGSAGNRPRASSLEGGACRRKATGRGGRRPAVRIRNADLKAAGEATQAEVARARTLTDSRGKCALPSVAPVDMILVGSTSREKQCLPRPACR